MQEWQGNPEDQQGEGTDHAAKGVGEDCASTGTGTLGRTSESLVQHLIQSVEHAANTDDDVAQKPVLRFLVIFGGASLGDFLIWAVSICNDKDTDDGDAHGKDLVKPQFLVEKRNGECICKKSRAVVYGGQVARRC